MRPQKPTALKTFGPAPIPELIAYLKHLLAQAESGELQALLAASSLTEGRTRVQTVGDFPSRVEQIGMAYLLLQHVTDGAIDYSSEVPPP